MYKFIVNLTLSQISLILFKFTYFIFIIINTYLLIKTQYLPQNTKFLSKLTGLGDGTEVFPIKPMFAVSRERKTNPHKMRVRLDNSFSSCH